MVTAHNESESEWFTGDNISIDNISPGVCARLEISPWLSQEVRTWIHSHQTFQQRRSENQGGHASGKKLLLYASLLAEGI